MPYHSARGHCDEIPEVTNVQERRVPSPRAGGEGGEGRSYLACGEVADGDLSCKRACVCVRGVRVERRGSVTEQEIRVLGWCPTILSNGSASSDLRNNPPPALGSTS